MTATKNKKTKRRVLFRLSPLNRLSFPVLLNAWEKNGIDKEFEIIIRREPLTADYIRAGDVILYSFMTSAIPFVHEEITKIKKNGKKNVLIVGGGPHITGEQELSFKMGLDILFIGPGERNFLHFGRDLLDNQPIKHTYAYTDEYGKQKKDKDKPHSDDDFNNHLPLSWHMATVPPLEIMRGCWWNCSYCGTHLHDVCFRDMGPIETYLRAIKKRGLQRVNFISPSAMEYGAARGRQVNLKKIAELLELTRGFDFPFIEYGIFPAEIRPDTATDAGMALLKKYVSNKAVTIGAQSSVDERLKELKRGHSVKDVEAAVAAANANHFLVNLDFILGYPDETPEERQTTIEFIGRLSKKYRIKTHLHHFIPLSGSTYAHRLPSFLPAQEKEQFGKLKSAGIAAGGWEANEKQVRNYLDWLKRHFPDYYSKYS